MNKLASAFVLFLLAAATYAQAPATGLPPYGSFQNDQFDVVNRLNLNATFGIPIVSTPGRGLPFNFLLRYNTLVWQPSSGVWSIAPANCSLGWSTLSPYGGANYVENYQDNSYWQWDGIDEIYCSAYTDTISNYAYVDASQTAHQFNSINWNQQYDECQNYLYTWGTYTQTASDGSGYYMDITQGRYSPSVMDTSGINIQGSGKITDRNGNMISSVNYTWTDSAGRTALTIVNPSGLNGNPAEYHYTDSTGHDQKFLLKYKSYSLMTHFGCSGVVDYNTGGTMPQVSLPYELDLPNGEEYQFLYEQTPSNPSYTTGRLTEVVLPTGGSYQYVYPGANDGIDCTTGSTLTLNRVISDGSHTATWQYVQTNPSGGDPITTVTMPGTGNQIVYTFNSAGAEISEQYYQGTASSGTLLRTVSRTWYTNGTPFGSTITLEDGSQIYASTTTYDVYGNLNSMSESSGSVGRKITNTFVSSSNYTARNIRNLLSSTVVTDLNNVTLSSKTFTYDGTTPTCVQGVPQHDDTNYGCSFNLRGNLTQVQSYVNSTGNWLTTKYSYNTLGNELQSTDPLSHTTSYSYSDAWANSACTLTSTYSAPTSTTDTLGHTLTSQYFPCSGQIASVTDANHRTISFTYDSMNRIGQESFPDGGTTTNTYSEPQFPSPSNPVSLSVARAIDSSRSLTTVNVFDGLGREIQTQLTSLTPSICSEIGYDPVGYTSSISNRHYCSGALSPTDGTTCIGSVSSGTCQQNGRDVLGRITTVTESDGSQSSVSYHLSCYTSTDEAGKQRKACLDGLGRLTQVFEDPGNLNYETDYSYDALDNLTQVVQKGGDPNSSHWRTRTFAFDTLSRMTQSSTPEAGTTNYFYTTSSGSLCAGDPSLACQRVDGRNITTTYSYDAGNRLTQRAYNDGLTPTASFLYDATSVAGINLTNTVGRLVQSSVNTGGVESIYSYDPTGRIVAHYQNTPKDTWQIFSVLYGYDLAGDLASTTNADGFAITYGLNSAGQVTSVSSTNVDTTHPATLAQGITYNPPGSPISALFGNGLTDSRAYDNRLQPCRINVNSSLASVAHCSDSAPSGNVLDLKAAFNYGSGDNGDVVSLSASGEGVFSRTYGYDTLDRLNAMSASGDYTGCFGLQWSYDPWGNRTAQTTTPNTGGSCPNFSASFSQSTNRMDNFSYDAGGDLQKDGNYCYTYDAEGHVLGVYELDCATTVVTYVYDAEGRRVETNYGSWQMDHVYDLNGNITAEWNYNPNSYIWFAGQSIYIGNRILAMYGNGSTYFVHPDHLGSTRMVTDLHGNPYEWIDYLPFGEMIYHGGTYSTNIHFTGTVHDWESGLEHFDARQEATWMGRWTSPDPLGGDISTPQSLNRYSYVLNNPLAFVDPMGLTCLNANGNVMPDPADELLPDECWNDGGVRWIPDFNQTVTVTAPPDTGAFNDLLANQQALWAQIIANNKLAMSGGGGAQTYQQRFFALKTAGFEADHDTTCAVNAIGGSIPFVGALFPNPKTNLDAVNGPLGHLGEVGIVMTVDENLPSQVGKGMSYIEWPNIGELVDQYGHIVGAAADRLKGTTTVVSLVTGGVQLNKCLNSGPNG